MTRTDAAGMRTLLADALGSTVALADGTGAVQSEYTYQPFGAASVIGPDANPVQYTGRENDGTGLHYYRARYYHPSLQRFIQEDTLLDIARPNRYIRDERADAIRRSERKSGRGRHHRHVDRVLLRVCRRERAGRQPHAGARRGRPPAAWRAGSSVPLTQRKLAACSSSAASSVE